LADSHPESQILLDLILPFQKHFQFTSVVKNDEAGPGMDGESWRIKMIWF